MEVVVTTGIILGSDVQSYRCHQQTINPSVTVIDKYRLLERATLISTALRFHILPEISSTYLFCYMISRNVYFS